MAKTRSERDLFEPGFLNELREKTINKYLENTHQKDVIKLEFSSDKHSKVYIGFNDQFEKVIKTTFNGETLVRFFNRELDHNRNEIPLSNPKRFERSTINLLIQYVNTSIEKDETSNFFLRNKTINGCDVIDIEKILQFKRNEPGHTTEDFYLGKHSNACQWVGVAKGWDHKREIVDEIITEINDSFNYEPKIAAVIYASPGYGKSVLMKRLAIDCVNQNFIILWLHSVRGFVNDNLKNLVSNLKYLIFVDDWSDYQIEELLDEFFRKIEPLNNIKIVMVDRDFNNKTIKRHLLGDNYFELNVEDNRDILIKIAKNSNWNSAINDLMKKDICNAPILIIVFIVASEHKYPSNNKTKGLLRRFLNIVEDDLLEIDRLFPGLAMAFYQLSFLYAIYGQTFTWNALQKLANNYGKLNSHHEFNFKKGSPLYEILSRYIYLEKPVLPFIDEYQVIIFHHKLLLDEGFYKVKLNGISVPFSKSEIMYFFYDNEEFMLAKDLLNLLPVSPDFNLSEKEKIYDSKISGSESFLGLLALNHTFIQLCKDAKLRSGEEFWAGRLLSFLHLFGPYFPPKYLQIILALLIKLGCAAICVSTALKESRGNEEYFLRLYSQLLHDYSQKVKGTAREVFMDLIQYNNAVAIMEYTETPPFLRYSLDAFSNP